MKKSTWFYHKKVQIAGLFLAAAVLAGGISAGMVSASFDEAQAVHIVSDEIEDATLIIGTHLIYMGALTDEIYELAEESESESGQSKRYYKSELAGGTWYDITDAASLADITTAGKPVSKEEIEAIFFTHHTKSDGKTYDLRTKEAVCIYDIKSPYDAQNLDELEPLVTQLDNLQAKDNKSDTDEVNIKSILELLRKDMSNDYTKDCDETISALQRYLDILTDADAQAEQISAVQKVMKSVDAGRRADVDQRFQENELEDLIKKVEDPASTVDTENNADFYVDYTLLSSIGECIDNMQSSLNECNANIITEGTTVLSKIRYRLTEALCGAARANDYSACDSHVEKLVYLTRIEGSSVVQADGELEFIEETLLPESDMTYEAALFAGEGDEYSAAAASKSTRSVLNQLLKTQKSEAEIIRAELQFILQAKLDRQTNGQTQEFLKERLNAVAALRAGVKSDDFSSYAQESIDSYEAWLTQKLQTAVDAAGQNEMDQLLSEKQKLITEKLAALDNNDLSGARKLEAEIEAKDQEIAKKEQELLNIVQSSTASAAQKAEAAGKLGANSAAGSINEMKDEVISDMRNGDFSSLTAAVEGIDALMQTSPDTALAAMQDIYKELAKQAYLNETDDGTNAEDEQTAATSAQKAIKEAMEAVENSIVENSSTLAGKLEAEELMSQIEALMGETSEDMSEENQALVLAAVSQYAQEGNDRSIGQLASTLAEQLAGNGNLYVYQKLKSESESAVYVPVDNIGKLLNYRYLFNDSQKQGILQKGASYYIFQAFSAEVGRQGRETESMDSSAGYQTVLYLPLSYVSETFGCEALYIPDSSYGVIYRKEKEEELTALLDYLYTNGMER